MTNVAEELGVCDYCLRKGRKRNLAKVTWLVNGHWNVYCPDCLQNVLDSTLELPWHREHGWKVEYPWRKNSE